MTPIRAIGRPALRATRTIGAVRRAIRQEVLEGAGPVVVMATMLVADAAGALPGEPSPHLTDHPHTRSHRQASPRRSA